MRTPGSSVGPRLTALAVAAATLLLIAAALAGAARAESPKLVSSPSITGVAMEGEVLRGEPGSYNGAEPPWSYEYEWFRCGLGGADCYSLGVKGAVYTVSTGDIGYRLRTWVLVTGLDCPEWTYNPPPPHRTCQFVTVNVPSELTPVVVPNPTFRPQSTAPPTISGSAEERSTLTAQDGGWSGAGPITTARQWERCDTGGNACSAIPGATASTYTLIREDIGRTMRVVVTASSPRGSSPAIRSGTTGVVRAFLPQPGRTTVGAALVEPPEKLVIDRVTFAPTPLRALEPVTVRVRVSDTRGFRIRGALVRVTAVPASLVAAARDVRTDAEGWASLRLRPTARVVLRPGGSIQLLVRAFRAGESPTGGVAAQRTAKLPLAAPRR